MRLYKKNVDSMGFLREYRNCPRRVVSYGRVCIEYEARVSALDNQMNRYQEPAAINLNWEVVGLYVDEDITGIRVFGFDYYRYKKQSALYLKKHGLPAGICGLKACPEWKLEPIVRQGGTKRWTWMPSAKRWILPMIR